MAISSSLKVYKDSYDLLLHLYQISTNFNKDFKYTLGEKIKNETLEILINIYYAGSLGSSSSLSSLCLRRVKWPCHHATTADTAASPR
jgi:hypothetical protein